jgi:hypothetical protein
MPGLLVDTRGDLIYRRLRRTKLQRAFIFVLDWLHR